MKPTLFILITFLIMLYAISAYAQAKDYRISDNQGNVLAINTDGSVNIK